MAGSVLALSMALAAATGAVAQNYDGYCYQKDSSPRTNGTVIGAVSGAVIGNVIAGKGNRTEGTILGGLLGGVIGNQATKNKRDTGQANCYQSRYYVYDDGYYAPPPPPRGYRTAYFVDRPRYDTYYIHREGRDYRWEQQQRREIRRENRQENRQENRDDRRNYNEGYRDGRRNEERDPPQGPRY
jgi:uncharacterized protein YcfJ